MSEAKDGNKNPISLSRDNMKSITPHPQPTKARVQTGNKLISNSFLMYQAQSRNADHAYSMRTPQDLAKAAEAAMGYGMS